MKKRKGEGKGYEDVKNVKNLKIETQKKEDIEKLKKGEGDVKLEKKSNVEIQRKREEN